MKQLSKSSSTLLFIVLTGLLLVVAFISYSKISQYSKSVDAVIHTNLVKSKIVEVVSNLKDANSGQRGYLLTNDTIFLQPFKEAEQRLDFLFVSIDSILSDNPMQQLHLKRLKSLVADSYLLMNKSLKLSKNNIPDSLINSALFTGKNKMDEVVKQISILLNEEDELLLQRTQIKDRSATFTPVFLLLLSLFSIFVITLFFFRLQKETSARVSTERLMEVQAEARKKIEAGEKRLSKIVHQSPFAFAILKGKDMVITLANDAIKEIWGKGKEVEGKPLFDLLPELKDSVFPKLFDDVYTTGTPHLENEILAKLEHNGVLKDMYFNLVYQPFHDANNAILGVTIIAVEVTTQVLAKRQIEESETKFRTLSETLRNMIWTAAPDGKKNFFNQYFLDYTGLSFEELIDDGILKIIFPDDLERDLQHWHHALKTGNEFKIEKRIRHRDGTYRWHLSHGIAQKDIHGNITGWIGSSTEIEEQKIFTEQLEAKVNVRTAELKKLNDELKQTNMKLDQFAHVASHDLQEPLRKINTFSMVLQDKYKNVLSTEVKSYLTKIEGSSKRMTSLINDLLNYSRLLQHEKSFSPTDLNETIKNIVNDFELLIHEKKAKIKFDKLPTIETIPLQMNQLFYNLISNSLKFSKEDTRPVINITSRTLTGKQIQKYPSFNPSMSYVELIFKDNGIGFEQRYAGKIFTIFQRLHDKETFTGTGIGLALTKKIIENHHGEIFAEAKENKGAEFHVILPTTQPH